jgi:hypothetical protein
VRILLTGVSPTEVRPRNTLPADMTIHNTVNISRLKKYTTDPAWERPPPPVQTVRDKDGMSRCSYIVKAIISHKKALWVKGGYKYHIKWKDYNDNETTLEPATNLSKAKQMLDNNNTQHGLAETKVKQNRKG